MIKEICKIVRLLKVRLDFLSLSLAQPDGNGVCSTDFLSVTGGASQIRRICGENSGQHMYVDFNGGNDITLTIQTTSAISLDRQWNIKVAQIDCTSPTRGEIL